MKYLKDNNQLLMKYLLIIVFNVILFIFTNFYLKNFEYKLLVLMGVVVLVDMIIYYLKGTIKFITRYDFIANFISGLILMLFLKDDLEYSKVILSVFFGNNIVFIRSRFSDNFLKRSGQYALILINTILSMFLSLAIYTIIK